MLFTELKGKTIAVLGDSISTNGNDGDLPNAVEIRIGSEDVGVPLRAYLTANDVAERLKIGGRRFKKKEIGTEVSFTPNVDDVGKVIGLPANYNPSKLKVWWEYLIEAFDCSVIPVCWSGASVTSHEGSKQVYRCSYAWHESQIRKCGIRIPRSMNRVPPDIVILYRGTNDFSHAPYARLTERCFDHPGFLFPVTDRESENVYGYKEGLVMTIGKLREAYPNAKLYLCTLNVFKRVNYDQYPTNNGFNTLPEYNDAIREVAEHMRCGLIEFDKDGITFDNCYTEGYITDSADHPTHPSAKGHAVMGKKAVEDIVRTIADLPCGDDLRAENADHLRDNGGVTKEATPTDTTPTDAELKPGDADGDGSVTSADARLALRASVGLTEKGDVEKDSTGYLACDVDGDGEITPTDARLILRASVGQEDASKFGKKA